MLGTLPLIGETRVEFLAPGFDLPSPGCWEHLGREPVGEALVAYLVFCRGTHSLCGSSAGLISQLLKMEHLLWVRSPDRALRIQHLKQETLSQS